MLTGTQWQIDIDENLLPDEQMLLERDFSIEIPRQLIPAEPVQTPVHIQHALQIDFQMFLSRIIFRHCHGKFRNQLTENGLLCYLISK